MAAKKKVPTMTVPMGYGAPPIPMPLGQRACAACGGSGKVGKSACASCGGTGRK